jgi:hypothetical protein
LVPGGIFIAFNFDEFAVFNMQFLAAGTVASCPG